jgi:hypothetical protein
MGANEAASRVAGDGLDARKGELAPAIAKLLIKKS